MTSYNDAGVSIDRGNLLVEKIKSSVKGTHRTGTMGDIGGFGALFDLSSLQYRNPVLVSGTDGVGTKILVAIETGKFDGIGIDLVAMCVNDLIVQGAEPLFFLDYYASARLDVEVAAEVVASIAQGCRIAGCALVGGETAEMPGLYKEGDFDLAGFAVGIVEKNDIIDGSSVAAGDVVIGLASNGPHANGYSLIRKVLADSKTQLTDTFETQTFADILLMPTRIYARPMLELMKQSKVKGIAHITGGGLVENIPRVMPRDVKVDIDTTSWRWPAIFNWLQNTGNIETAEMYRTFNCGVGMAVIVDPGSVDRSIAILAEQGEQAWLIGRISERTGKQHQVTLI